MAQCKETAREFIQDVFSPMVAVLCSSDVETVCQKNGLSFVELIQPFCRLTSEAHIRDPSNVSHPIRNLHIVVHDMNNHPPQNVLARKLLNDVVSNSLPQHSADMMPNNVVTMGNHDLQLDATTPWFEAYRTAFLQIAYPSDHEFLRHYLACIFVVSSSNADPIEQFVKLTHQQSVQQHQQPHKLPKWFMPNILRYYVLVHDVAEQEEAKVETIYQTLKTKYGVQACHLLHINSRSPTASNAGSNDVVNMPNPWSRFITQKQEMSESAEFESFLRPGEEETDEFPSHVTEGSLPSVSTDVDLALEAIEDDTSTSSHVICHPLESDTGVLYDPLLSDSDSAVSVSSHSANHAIAKLLSGSNAVDQSTAKAVRSVPLGACLTLSDHDRLRIFINEFIVRGLIFWAEKTVRTLNEQLTTRKGLHRSFFSATKKWFGGNKQTNPAIITYSTNVVYTSDAPEMQMRRLADLAFMFQLYELAYQIYHSAKKDFNNDHAWLHYAGAMEMACLSIFMQDSVNQRQYPLHYMETTITTYLAACKVPHFATRATLLSTEVLKAKGLYAEAALQFIKMTSEESDLRSALLLEQAAHCFVKMKPPMVRKYAFHMILAGHRFNKSGQKRHALRSYAQALQVYKGRYWMIAEDHINYTIGCQSFNLKQFDIAKSAFKHLLSTNSQQSLPQQTAFLREYLSVFKQLAHQTPDDEVRELPELPLPVVEFNTTKVLCVSEPERLQSDNSGLRIAATGVSFNTSDGENARFARLEEVILSKGAGSGSQQSSSFKPTIQCYTHTTNNAASPVIAAEEPVTVEVTVINPLKVTLVLREVELLWRFVPDEDTNAQTKFFSNEVEFGKSKSVDSVIHSSPLAEVLFEGSDIKKIQLTLVIHLKGQLQITGLGYYIGCMSALGHVLTSVVPDGVGPAPGSNVLPFNGTNPSALPGPVLVSGKVCLEVQGPRLNSTKEERLAKVYGPDRRLNLIITNKMPMLEVFFQDFPSSLFAGQMCQVFVELVNAGHRPLHNVQVATSSPEFFTFSAEKQTNDGVVDQECSSLVVRKPDIVPVTRLGIAGPMEPGFRTKLPMWIRGPDVPGDHVIDFLFYYEPTDAVPFMSHRVVRHTAQLTIYQSLIVRTVCNRMVSPVTDETTGIDCSTYAVYASIEAENICSVPDAPSLSIVQTLGLSRDWTIAEINVSGTMKGLVHGTGCVEWIITGRRQIIEIVSEENFFVLSCLCFCPKMCKLEHKNVSFALYKQTGVTTQIPHLKILNFRLYLLLVLQFSFVEPLKVVPAGQNYGHPRVESNPGLSLTEKLEKAVVFDLNLIIQWQAVMKEGSGMRTVAVGQHHVTINRLNALVTSPPLAKLPADLPPVKFISSHLPVLTLEPSSELLAQLVRFSFHYRPEVSHDFSQNRLCIVPVVIHLFNCTDVQICIDIDTMAGQARSAAPTSRHQHHQALGSIGQGHPMRPFTWSGLTITRLHLAPDRGHSIPLKACFVTSGVYDLGTAQVLAFPAASGSGIPLQTMMQRPLAPSFITIHGRPMSNDGSCRVPS